MSNNKAKINKELFIPVVNNIRSKRYDEALSLLDQLLNENQDKNIIHKLKASVYLKKKEWKKSLTCYEKIENGENNHEITNNIGVALYNLGKLSEASNKFKASINLNNSYLPAFENLVLAYELLGKYELCLKFINQALKIDPHNKKIIKSLVDIFNYYDPEEKKNSIVNTNYEISKLNSIIKKNKIIENSLLKNIFEKSEEILKVNNIKFGYPQTQILKMNTKDLNCKRHLNIFSTRKIISKFCFSCYKVQITLECILDLLKLYFYFNNLYLKENNIRKCVIELRKNVSGNYKGYIFTRSTKESEEIIKLLKNDSIDKEINIEKIEIKHGCTEYYEEYPLFKKTDRDMTNEIYQDKWTDIEKEFDEKNLIKEISEEKIINKTINKFNLPDYLIIKNWLIYAKTIGDLSYQKVFKSEVQDNKLSGSQKKLISQRKMNSLN